LLKLQIFNGLHAIVHTQFLCMFKKHGTARITVTTVVLRSPGEKCSATK